MIEISLSDYDRLIHRIYQAGLLPDGWSVFVEDLAQLLGESIICLHAQDAVGHHSLGVLSSKADPEFLRAYDCYYGALNVWTDSMLAAPVGKVMQTDEVYPREDLLKTEFYNDYLRTQDLISAAGVTLHKSPTRCLYLSGNIRERNAEKVQAPLLQLFELLGPHISRSVELMRMIPRSVDGEDLYATAERATDAVFFINQAGRLVYENRGGSDLRNEIATVQLDRGGEFHLRDRQADAVLQTALGAIRRRDYVGMRGTLFIRSAMGAPRRATLAPLQRNAEAMVFDQAFEDRPVAMLVIQTPAAGAGPAVRFAGYGLTGAELALALAIAKGLSPREYADSRGISVQTARTQLKSVFAKTGVSRQSQLAALASRPGQEDGA